MSKEGCLNRIAKYTKAGNTTLLAIEEKNLKDNYSVAVKEEPKEDKKAKK